MGQSTLAAARAKARRRNREHIRRSTVSDITAEQELAMRRKARKCPLCGVSLTSKTGLPNSKHLDHIIPICVGGTHTWGNTRVICASCNLHRPKDGSDYSGPVTLWAQGPSPVKRQRKKRTGNVTTCRKGLHPWVASNIKIAPNGKKRCRACDKTREQTLHERRPCSKCGALSALPGSQAMCPDCIDATARKAAELHAAGGLGWNEIAAVVGYGSGEGIRYAARRIGYIDARHAPACAECGAPKPAVAHRWCGPCTTAKAWQAVEMYRSGMALKAIAVSLGYSEGNRKSVSLLMKSVTAVEMRIGRPARTTAL